MYTQTHARGHTVYILHTRGYTHSDSRILQRTRYRVGSFRRGTTRVKGRTRRTVRFEKSSSSGRKDGRQEDIHRAIKFSVLGNSRAIYDLPGPDPVSRRVASRRFEFEARSRPRIRNRGDEYTIRMYFLSSNQSSRRFAVRCSIGNVTRFAARFAYSRPIQILHFSPLNCSSAASVLACFLAGKNERENVTFV